MKTRKTRSELKQTIRKLKSEIERERVAFLTIRSNYDQQLDIYKAQVEAMEENISHYQQRTKELRLEVQELRLWKKYGADMKGAKNG